MKAAIAAAVNSEAASRGVQLHPVGGDPGARMPAKSFASSPARSLQSAPTTMTMTNQTLETLSVDQLAPVTGGGIGTTIGSLFGAKGQKWGAFADNLLGLFQGGGAGGLGGIFGKLLGGMGGGSPGSGSAPAPAAPSSAG